MGREIPMDQPQRANVFQKGIEALLTKHGPSENGGPPGGPIQPDSDLRTVIEAWPDLLDSLCKEIIRIVTTRESSIAEDRQ